MTVPVLPVVAGIFGAVVVASAVGERARSRRRNLDRVGVVDWRTVQVLGLIGLAVTGGLALHA